MQSSALWGNFRVVHKLCSIGEGSIVHVLCVQNYQCVYAYVALCCNLLLCQGSSLLGLLFVDFQLSRLKFVT